MTEHLFSHGPNRYPPPDVLVVLERVAAAHGLMVITYPTVTEFDPHWAFHGHDLGRPDTDDLEARVRAALVREPAFRRWCQEHHW